MLPLIAATLLATSAPKTKLVSIVWDGAADWVVDRLLAEGALPNVARLAQAGVSAESVIPAWPSKTAVGHASLFNCCWPDRHGVTNNTVGLLPRAEHGVEESMRGFDGRAVQTESVWVTAALAGRKVLALSAATSFPPDPYIERIKKAGGNPKNFVEFSGFETEWAAGKMIDIPADAKKQNGRIEFSVSVAGSSFDVAVIDDPQEPTPAFDTVVVSRGDRSFKLRPRAANESLVGWSPEFTIKKDGSAANVYFRLWSLDAEGKTMELYQRKVSPMYGTEPPSTIERYVEAYGGFHDDPFFPYERGMFGKTLFQGGDGEAEKRVLELVKQDCDFLKRSFAYGWKTWKPDVLFHYTPMSDSAGHVWMGALDEAIPDHDPLVAAKLWPFYKQVYKLQDEWLGFILDSVGKDTVVALMSDHGMAGARSYVYLNNALEKAGLLTRTASGQIDWSKTKAAIPAWSDFFVVVNGVDRKGGIVPGYERPAVLAAVRKALLGVRDPKTEDPIVTAVFEPEDAQGMGIGGPTGGDVYFELAPGYYPSNRANASITAPYGREIGGGVHGFFPYRRSMGAIFYASGPGLPNRRHLPIVRHIDVFPTLFKAVGLPMPKDAVGTAY